MKVAEQPSLAKVVSSGAVSVRP